MKHLSLIALTACIVSGCAMYYPDFKIKPTSANPETQCGLELQEAHDTEKELKTQWWVERVFFVGALTLAL